MSEIGALSVRIGADTADLKKGLGDAQNEVNKFSGYVKDLSSDLKVLAAGAGVVTAAVGLMVREAINAADAFADLSERTGISTTALSKLEYAAKFADLSLGELQGGLVSLTRNMSAANMGTGEAADAFAALGVEYKNANGTLRASDEVILDLADRFSNLENGTNKTALAIQIFGRAGAQMIPFLNMGRDGIKEFSEELELFGGVITPEASAQAGIFNDNLDRLKAAAAGAAQQLSQSLLPSMNQILNALLAINQVRLEKGFWSTLLGLTELGQLLTGDDSVDKRVAEIMRRSQEAQRKALEQAKTPGQKEMAPIVVSAEQVKKAKDLMDQHVLDYMAMMEAFREQEARRTEELQGQINVLDKTLLDERGRIALEYEERLAILNEARLREILTEEEFANRKVQIEEDMQTRLAEARKRGLTELQRFNEASFKDQAKTVAQQLMNMTASVTRESRAMFNINKAASLANAVVSTYEGINKALASYPPPLSFAMAAAQAAAGFANVRAIASQQFGSGAAAPSVASTTPAGATAVSPVGGGGGGGTMGQQVVTINLTGEIFGRDQVRGLISQINEAISDGAQLRLQ